MTELNRKCILLEEADVLVRNLIGTLLSGEGYILLGAANAAEAMELSSNYPGEIRLLISTNRELAEKIRASRPELRVILLSPYTSTELQAIVRNVSPSAFVHRAALPRRLLDCIQWAFAHTADDNAIVEV